MTEPPQKPRADPTKNPEFQKVVQHFLKSPPKPHKAKPPKVRKPKKTKPK